MSLSSLRPILASDAPLEFAYEHPLKPIPISIPLNKRDLGWNRPAVSGIDFSWQRYQSRDHAIRSYNYKELGKPAIQLGFTISILPSIRLPLFTSLKCYFGRPF